MDSQIPTPNIGLILSAGGARAAYQVGAIRAIARQCPEFNPKIFCGISAGSINSSYLAQGEPIVHAADNLYELWANLSTENVFKTNFRSVFAVTMKIFNDLFISKVTKRLTFHSILDATPLAETLITNIRFPKIANALADGIVQGIAVTATNYHTGNATVFYDTHKPVPPWHRLHRQAISSPIRIRHIMASCSLPILFEPVKIGEYLYGDGTIRFSNPFSPAIHMGASHIVAIGTSCPTQVTPGPVDPSYSMGFVAGSVLNSIFLDSLEPDFAMLLRFNEIAQTSPAIRYLNVKLLQPSLNPGVIAKEYFEELPFNFRQLIKTAAITPEDAADLISYLMFTKGYIGALLKLGEEDGARHAEDIKKLLNSETEKNGEGKSLFA